MKNEFGETVCTFRFAIERARVVPGLIFQLSSLFNISELTTEEQELYWSLYKLQFDCTDKSVDELTEEEMKLMAELLPIFSNDRMESLSFIRAIEGADETEITEHVKCLIKDHKVVERSCHKKLWSVLYNAGRYTYSSSNWNYHLKTL